MNIGFIMIIDVVVMKLRAEEASWIADTVNQSHLDLFYAALPGVSIANLLIFAYVARFYCYRDFPEEEDDDEQEGPHKKIKTGKKPDKMEPTPDEETERTIRIRAVQNVTQFSEIELVRSNSHHSNRNPRKP